MRSRSDHDQGDRRQTRPAGDLQIPPTTRWIGPHCGGARDRADGRAGDSRRRPQIDQAAGADRRPPARRCATPPMPSMCCRSRRFCAARPTCWSRRRRPAGPVNVKKASSWRPGDMKHVAAKKITRSGNADVMLYEREHQLRLQHPGFRHAVLPMWRRWAIRWCLTRPIPCSSREGWAGPRAGSGNSCRCWRAPPLRSGWPRFSWKPIPTPTARPPTGPTSAPTPFSA